MLEQFIWPAILVEPLPIMLTQKMTSKTRWPHSAASADSCFNVQPTTLTNLSYLQDWRKASRSSPAVHFLLPVHCGGVWSRNLLVGPCMVKPTSRDEWVRARVAGVRNHLHRHMIVLLVVHVHCIAYTEHQRLLLAGWLHRCLANLWIVRLSDAV